MTRLIALFMMLALVACGDEDKSPTPPPAPGDVLFVDGIAQPGGNGSQAAPFQTIAQALNTEGATQISVAVGTYEIPAQHTFDTDLQIGGAGPGETFFINRDAAEDGVEWTLGGRLGLNSATLFVGLRITGGAFEMADIEGSGQNVAISLDAMDEATLNGLSLRKSGALSASEVTNLTMTGVEIAETDGPAILLQDTTATLTDITIEDITQEDDSGGDGIRAEGGALTLQNAEIRRVADRGIALIGAEADLDGVIAVGSSRGLLFVAEGSKATVANLEASEGRICVFVNGSELAMTDSQIGPCGSNGVLIGDGSKGDFTNTELSDCPGGHISYLGAETSGKVERCTLRGAQETCLSVAGTGDFEFLGNTISECEGSAIGLLGSYGGRIEDNTIFDIAASPAFPDVGDGLGLVDADAMIIGNTITDVAKRGITMVRSSGTLDSNTLCPCGDAGISFTDPATPDVRSTVLNNIITEATGVGVGVFTQQVDVTDNVITDTRLDTATRLGDGLAFAIGADFTAQGNTISGSAASGIFFTEAVTGSITGNTITGNTLFGILELCGELSDVEVADNTFMDNGRGPTSLCE